MMLWIMATVLLLCGASALYAQSSITPADSAEILSTVANWERAWTVRDAELAAQDYADDADWTNALGCVGSVAIASKLCSTRSLSCPS